MNKSKIAPLVGILFISASMLTACGQKEISQITNEEPKYYSISIDGDYLPREEDDMDVNVLTEVSKGFLAAAVSRDYKNIDTVTEYGYYTKEVYEKYMQMGRPEAVKASAIENQLVVNLHEADIKKIEFYKLKGQEASSVTIEYISSYIEGTESYLNQLKVKKGSKYKRTMTIKFIKEDGEWKVQETSATAREEV